MPKEVLQIKMNQLTPRLYDKTLEALNGCLTYK